MYALLVCGLELRRRLGDPTSLALMTLVPLGIAVIVTFAFGGSGDDDGAGAPPLAKVWVVDRDQSLVSQLLLSGMERAPGLPIELVLADDEPAARRRLDRGDGTALLVVPEGFDRVVLLEQPGTLQLVVNPVQSVLPQLVQQALELGIEAHFYSHRVLGSTLQSFAGAGDGAALNALEASTSAVQLGELSARLGPWVDPPRLAVDVTIETPEQDPEEQDDGFGLGAIVMASLLAMTVMFAALGLSEDLWVERRSGTLLRARAAPRPLAQWLAGKLLAYTCLFAAVIALAFPIARYGFGVEFTGGLLPVLWIAAGGTVFATLLMLAQTTARDQRGGSIAASLVTYPLLALGGGFFPLEAMPDGLAAIGAKTPVGWALGRSKVMLAGAAEPAQVALDVALLTAVGAVLFLLLLRRLPGFASR